MTETVKRRRWPWVVLGLLLLVIGVPIAWRFRPLNSEEKRLVGRWRSEPTFDGAAIVAYHFADSRRYTFSGVFREESGTWQMSEGVLTFQPDRTELPTLSDAIAAWKAFVDPSSTWHDVTILRPSGVRFETDDQLIKRDGFGGIFDSATRFRREQDPAL